MPSPLPNGKQQFFDGNGSPLAGGSVTHYVPGTTTPATTWQDSAGTIPNLNPLDLDAYGMAVIWGSGSYRQVVKNAAGVTIWDQVSAAVSVAGGAVVSAAMQSVVAAATLSDAQTAFGVSALGTPDTTGAWDLFGSGSLRAGAVGYNNSVIGMAINNLPANTTAFPTGITGYGKIVVGSSGNQVFGVFGRADQYAPGVATNEVNVFNYSGAPDPTLPPNRAIGTTTNEAICLTVAAGGSYQDKIGVHITPEGSVPNSFLYGLYMSPGAATTGGLVIDAPTTSSFVGATIRAPTTGICTTFQTIGGFTPANAMVQGLDNSNTERWSIRQNGDYRGGNYYPLVDNTTNLGGGTLRFAAVFAVNGTIQTSDPTLKTDIAELPPALPIIAAITPRTYRWKVGGYDTASATEERTVQATETQTVTRKEISIENGKPVQRTVTETREVSLFDEVPVVDEAGNPVMVPKLVQPAVKDKSGQIIEPAVYDGEVQLTHHVPRMVTKQVAVEQQVPREGKRTHWGFLASDIKAAMPAGMDWAAYVKDADGTEHMRPDQLVPVLWKAVQELAEQIALLKPGSTAPTAGTD